MLRERTAIPRPEHLHFFVSSLLHFFHFFTRHHYSPEKKFPGTAAVTTTRSPCCVTAAVSSRSLRLLLAGFEPRAGVMPRARVTSVAIAAAWLAAVASEGAISSTRRCKEPVQRRLAMMVESGSRGRARPKT